MSKYGYSETSRTCTRELNPHVKCCEECPNPDLPVRDPNSWWDLVAFMPRPRPTLPTVEALARALFETDEDVRNYVRSRCDGICKTGPGEFSVNVDRVRETLDTCWRINDQGFRSKCEARAEAMLKVLGR